jgi:methyltransferase (TIGR00027 family)
MDAATPSRTAMFCSLHRARHSRHDPKPLIDDTWGDQLVPDSIRDLLFEFALSTMDENARLLAMKSRETTLNDRMKASAAYCNAVLRCRYTEDMLEAAAARGVDQYVVIGAGLDSFAVRRPPFARDMQVFEVDHPATQDFKLKRFRELGTAIPSSTHFASSDLSNEDIGSALARTPYRSDRPAFFCWLGVTIYLTREANLDNLKAISWCAGPRSELVFTYFEQSVFGSTSNSEAFKRMQKLVASGGEPFISGFDPLALGETLKRVGWNLLEDLDESEMLVRYDVDGENDMSPLAKSRFAHARIL